MTRGPRWGAKVSSESVYFLVYLGMVTKGALTFLFPSPPNDAFVLTFLCNWFIVDFVCRCLVLLYSLPNIPT